MGTSAKNVIIFSVLLIILLTTSGILLMECINSYKRSGELSINLKRTALSNEISEDINRMVANVQDYILYSDQQYLDDFKRNSSLTIKYELELYNVFNPSKKQEVEELIEFTKAYISFVEKEVVPAIQLDKKSEADIKYIQLRHKDFIRDMYKKSDAVAAAGKGEIQSYYEKNVIDRNYFIVFVLVLLLLSLALIIVQSAIMIRPVMIRRLYLEKLAASGKSAVVIVNRKGVVELFNQSARNLLGISPEAVLNKNLSEIAAAFPHLHAVTQPLNDAILHEQEITSRVTLLLEGKKNDLLADYIPVFALGVPVGAVMVAVRAEEKKHKQVLLETLEAERKRISIEIHDWIGRHMSTMIHSLDYILRLNGGGSRDQLRESLTALRGHCQNAAIEMRGIMNNIHPYLIDKLGLIPALESYISIFEKLNNIKVYIMYQDRSLKVKKRDEIIIYRIIQEALTNVAKHSRSTEVDIEFTLARDTLRIDVSDNGGAVGEFTAGKGLWGMKERANLAGGEIVFGSTGSGFCVTLTVPIISGGRNDGRENQNNAH